MRETRPAHRPEGCRVHFLKLSATGANHYIPKMEEQEGRPAKVQVQPTDMLTCIVTYMYGCM